MKKNLQKMLKRRMAQLGMLAMLSAASLNAWATAHIQDLQQVKVTIGFTGGETLEKAFKRLGEISKVPFNYNHNELRRVQSKSLEFNNEPLKSVLISILNGTN